MDNYNHSAPNTIVTATTDHDLTITSTSIELYCGYTHVHLLELIYGLGRIKLTGGGS